MACAPGTVLYLQCIKKVDIMVSNLQLKVIGYLLMGAGVLFLLWGFCTWTKQVMATGFIACLIALTVLYYSRQLEPKGKKGQ